MWPEVRHGSSLSITRGKEDHELKVTLPLSGFCGSNSGKKWPGKFICQMSVLLEVTKTCETARAFQPKPKQGEGSGKEKRLFLAVLLSFASEFGLTRSFFRHQNETEIKPTDLLSLLVTASLT